jgi:hypothetical protein
MEINPVMTFWIKASEQPVLATASAFALALALAALLFSGPAKADYNPLIGVWGATAVATRDGEPDSGAAEFFASGGKIGLRITETTFQMTSTSEGRTQEAEPAQIVFSQESETAWNMCAPDGTNCTAAVFLSPDTVEIYPPDPAMPVMLFARER